MATLRRIPVTFPSDKIPTKEVVRDIVGNFFPKEWRPIDPDTLTLFYQPNYTNPHCTVERPVPQDHNNTSEPTKVFIKFLDETSTGIDIFQNLVPTKDQDTELCDEYSRSGPYGVRVFGYFQTEDGMRGRIDEFMNAHNLRPEDVEDESIRADIATALAGFHLLKTSLTNVSVQAYYDAVIPGLRQYHRSESLKALGVKGGVNIDDLVDYDFARRLQHAIDAMKTIDAKSGWCIHDMQFMNTMVRNNPQQDESKIVLIDFEMVMRNYRGFDIGAHFMQKMFKWFDEKDKIADCRKYTDDEKRHFCDVYAEAWNKATGDSDTGEQVFRESEYGYLCALTFDIHNMLWFANKMNEADSLDLKGLLKLFEEFTLQYRKLGLPRPST